MRDLLQLWVPYIQLSDIATALTDQKNGVTGRLDRLKKVIIAGMVVAARTQLRKKITREGWSQGISFEWVDLVSDAPKKWCNGVARFTLLRWAVNQDDDIWLTLRGTRHNRLCGSCLQPGDTFPGGFYNTAIVNIDLPLKELHQYSIAPLVFSCKLRLARHTVLLPPLQRVQPKLLSL